MKNIHLISASAGSGKTYYLMNQIADRVVGKDGCSPVAPEQILATTFTNKAASELNERIRMCLLEEGRVDDAQRIYDGLIGTVNSICARLLKEYAFEAGLSPAVDVLPPEDVKRVFKMATTSAIKQYTPVLEPIARRMGLNQKGMWSSNSDWQELVNTIVDSARANAMSAETLRQSAKQSWDSIKKFLPPNHLANTADDANKMLHKAFQEAVRLHRDEGEKINATALDAIQRYLDKMDRGWELPWTDWHKIEKINIGKGARGSERIKALWEPWSDESWEGGYHLQHPGLHRDIEQMITGVFDCAIDSLNQYEHYKKVHGVMDFADQEVMVLDLIQHNAEFRVSIQNRIKLMMVDEFQDTSPIQLQLFLALAELAEEVIFVGDQKQSIYGFRGSDPNLIIAVENEIESLSSGQDATILEYSWRSKERLVDVTNALFTPVFHQMGAEKVALKIPPERTDEAKDGWLGHWKLNGKNKGQRISALAEGIKQLLAQREALRAGDIAVLCRTNGECEALSVALTAIGISASISNGEMFATDEATLTLAALRFLVDPCDTVSLAEIVCYSAEGGSGGSWLAPLLNDPKGCAEDWKSHPIPQALSASRDQLVSMTPLEALELAIAQSNVEQQIARWGDVQQRMGNIDQLRSACISYQGRCQSLRTTATVVGFIRWLEEESELKQVEGEGIDTVKILTYHKSKGLEWPVVILADLNKASSSNLFGVSVESTGQFDPNAPLAGRTMQFFPWPYGQTKITALQASLDDSDLGREAEAQRIKESQRLLYVGITRARDGIVFASDVSKKKASHRWLDDLCSESGVPVFELDGNKMVVRNGEDEVAFDVAEESLYEPEEDRLPSARAEQPRYLPIREEERQSYQPANITPSGVKMDADELSKVEVMQFADLGGRLPLTGNPDMADLGSALHGFFAADLIQEMEDEERTEVASGLLERWGIEAITAENMLVASDRLKQFIDEKYPDATVRTEWPIEYVMESNQRMSGWIDLLLETEEGFVVIDHKTFPGRDVEERIKKYAAQLNIYREAIESGADRCVVDMLIYLPVIGGVYCLREGE